MKRYEAECQMQESTGGEYALFSDHEKAMAEKDSRIKTLTEALKLVDGHIETAGAERMIKQDLGQLGLYFKMEELRTIRKALSGQGVKP